MACLGREGMVAAAPVCERLARVVYARRRGGYVAGKNSFIHFSLTALDAQGWYISLLPVFPIRWPRTKNGWVGGGALRDMPRLMEFTAGEKGRQAKPFHCDPRKWLQGRKTLRGRVREAPWIEGLPPFHGRDVEPMRKRSTSRAHSRPCNHANSRVTILVTSRGVLGR